MQNFLEQFPVGLSLNFGFLMIKSLAKGFYKNHLFSMKNITISLVIPVYNEEKRIKKTIKALSKGFDYEPLKLEKVIFVNDGSIDNTVEILEKNIKSLEKALKASVQIVSYKSNKGKGYAIKTGMKHSNSEYTLMLDADMSTPINQIKKLIPYIIEGKDVIIGTRKNGESTVQVHQPIYRELLGRGFTYLTNLMLNTWVSDFTCGFKAFSRKSKNKIFPKSKIDRWSYDAELMFLAKKYGFKITEKSVLWYDDKDTRVKLLKSMYTSFKELIQIRFYNITGKYGFAPFFSINPKITLAKLS